MRHYFWYDSNGEIRGQETHDRGFVEDCDPRMEDTTHPVAAVIREARLKRPDHGGWVPFDCRCPAETVRCKCASYASVKHFVAAGKLVPKPALQVIVDGELMPKAKTDVLDRPPGTKLAVQLRGEIPNGHSLLVRGSKGIAVVQADTTVVFNDGASPVITVTSPAQGMTGWIYGASKYVRPFGVYVRGWA